MSNKTQDVLTVQAEHSPRTGAITVQPERRHSGDDVAATEVVGPAGVAKAGAARRSVVRQQEREVPRKARRVDLDQVRLSTHADLLRLDEHGVDPLQAVAHGGEHRRAARLQRVELVHGGKLAVLVDRELDGLAQQDDPHVVQEERALGKERMRMPRRGLDGVGAGERVVVVPVLHVRLREDAHAAELAGLPGAVAGGEHDLLGNEGAGAAERRLPADIHHDEDDGGMGVAVGRAVCDEGGAIWALSICGDSLAAEQAEAGGGKDRDECTHAHDSSSWLNMHRQPAPDAGGGSPL